MQTPVRELKARLSHYLKLAARGEEVIVTSRGRPIARLLPPAPPPVDKRLSPGELRRRLADVPGILLGKPGKPRLPHSIKGVKLGRPLADIVLEDRN